MQAVKHGAVDEIGGPNHGSGPHQEAAGEACHAVTGAERGNAKEKLKRPAKGLLVEQALRQEDIGGIQSTATICGLHGCVSQRKDTWGDGR